MLADKPTVKLKVRYIMCINAYVMRKSGVRKNSHALRGVSAGSVYDVEFIGRCGHCILCLKRVQNEWIVRNHYEDLDNPASYFITLTYDVNKYDGRYIRYNDVQLFIKRMRESLRVNGYTFRYFLACEYGKVSHRANYHIIVYGSFPIDDLRLVKIDKNGNDIYSSSYIENLWSFGFVGIQLVNNVSALSNYLNEYSPLKGDATARKKQLFAKLYSDYSLSDYNPCCSCEAYGVCPNKDFKSCNSIKYKYGSFTIEKGYKRYISSIYNEVKEKRVSSISLGWDSFYKRVQDYIDNECVYIQGIPYRIPFSWLSKLAVVGTSDEIAFAKAQYSKLLALEFDASKVADEYKLKGNDKMRERFISQVTDFMDDDMVL